MEEKQIINNMCYTWRHDYGLLDEQEKTFLFNQMKQVFENNIKNEIVTQGEVDDYLEQIELLEEKLEDAIKPKMCYECKFFSEHPRYQAGYCSKGITNMANSLKTVDYKFGCNQCEPKDNA